jgi:hypothetical protein
MQEEPAQQTSEEADWEVTAEGLYMATRSFLVRRGYCCANRCRNCPYVNWRNDPQRHGCNRSRQKPEPNGRKPEPGGQKPRPGKLRRGEPRPWLRNCARWGLILISCKQVACPVQAHKSGAQRHELCSLRRSGLTSYSSSTRQELMMDTSATFWSQISWQIASVIAVRRSGLHRHVQQ